MDDNCEECGERVRVSVAGENCYLAAFRCLDGGIDYVVTVPRENSPEKEAERMIAETICREASRLSRMV